ncbi:aminotransferase [Burkholderiaceae bacterium 26]|nr:aminotransferase [Burkholderiaceae bacterium 26]
MIQLSPQAVREALVREQEQFSRLHPVSKKMFEEGQQHYLYGAPSHWFRRWAGKFPVYAKEAKGTELQCVDGHRYVDFCLGDTGAMCGHAPSAVTKAVSAQLDRGATLMLPTEKARWVGEELAARFGLPYWGFTTSASDANRAAIRIARMITGREKVLVFSGCYHGSVEEAHVALDSNGKMIMRNGIHPNAVDHERVSVVVEFNDIDALEEKLAAGDVACVLTEPFMTNYGMVAPAPGFHGALRELTRRHGTLLLVDETHTFSSGPGGYTKLHSLQPDMLVLGKAVGGGIPVGLYGVSEDVARRMWAQVPKVDPTKVRQSAHLGFGGTLAGSALQVEAVRAVLAEVLTPSAFDHMVGLAKSLAPRMREVVSQFDLPWYVEQLGARVEIMFAPDAPRNAADVAAGRDGDLEALLHVYFLNRGVLITPFHCMLLMCPASVQADSDKYVAVLKDFCEFVVRECRVHE